MSTNYKTFQSETTAIMAFVVETAMTKICQLLPKSDSSYGVSNPERELCTVLNLVAVEAVRKICQLFLAASSSLQKETEILKTKLEQMDEDLKAKVEQKVAEIKAMTEKAEHYRSSLVKVQAEARGPTHVLHDGIIFEIKPIDRPVVCFKSTEISSLDHESSLTNKQAMDVDPTPGDTESNVEQMRAVLPENDARESDGRRNKTGTAKGTESAEIKRFKCDVCESSFSWNKSLTQHKVTHTKHMKCDICEMTFPRKELLESPKLTHVKPFKCDVCDKTFHLNRLLRRDPSSARFVERVSLKELSLLVTEEFTPGKNPTAAPNVGRVTDSEMT
ncbi:hypothetical protein UPYG_G00276800 [Umbra pygmaea]|uniref:C2H2-type domain-containing protein n=1 Tax=Umbra pygmaea TaxID=75934 RepID=A0ABD0W339_UMBPY